MNTECLNDNEFNNWGLFYFHCKIWNANKEEFIYISYSNFDKQQVRDQFKDDCEEQVMGLNNNCRILSIRKGKRVYPELHERVLNFNKEIDK